MGGNAESIQTAQHGGRWSFTCQHTIMECVGNMYISCFLDLDGVSQSEQVEVVSCLMSEVQDHYYKDATLKCMDMQQLDDKLIKMDLVKECAISHYGEELLLEMGNKTDSLNPKHTFVPWITFNDESNPAWQDQAVGNFENFICKNFLQNVPECSN